MGAPRTTLGSPASRPRRSPPTPSTACPRERSRRAANGAGRGAPAAHQARNRPDRPGHPPRARGRPAQAARVPGGRAPRRADRRRLHRPRGRSLGRRRPCARCSPPRRSRPTPPPSRSRRSRILDPDPERLELRRNSEWLQMPMVELLRLVGTTTAAQLLERDDFAEALVGARAESRCSSCSIRSCRGTTRWRSTRTLSSADRSEVQLAARARHPARLRPARAGDPDDAALRRHRRAPEDVQVPRQPDRITDPPEEMYGETMAIPDEALEEYRRLLHRPRHARVRSERVLAPRRQAHARPRAGRHGCHSSRRDRRPPTLRPRLRAARGPRGAPGRPLPGAPQGVVHLPAVITQRVRDLALGGPAPDRPGRRGARR